MKPNIGLSPKSPRIELSNDAFAEKKCCQVFVYESETFHRRRPNGISHCENGEQKPSKLPLPLARCGPHVIQQCLGPPHAPPKTTAPTVETLSHMYAVKSPLVTMARPKFAQKYPFPWTDPQTPLPASSLDPSDDPTYDAKRHPDPIRRFSTMHWTDRQADRPTDRPTGRSRESLMTIARSASNESDAARPNNFEIIAVICFNVRITTDGRYV